MVDIELLQQIIEECNIALNEDGVTEVETRRYTFIRDTAKNILKESIFKTHTFHVQKRGEDAYDITDGVARIATVRRDLVGWANRYEGEAREYAAMGRHWDTKEQAIMDTMRWVIA